MKTLATILALAAIAIPSAYAAESPMSDVQLSRPSIAQQYAEAAPLSDVQLSRYGSRTATPVVIPSRDKGFNWTDASIGAAVMLGATLLALTAALAVRSTRGRFQRA